MELPPRIKREFYKQPLLDLARQLPGKILVKEYDSQIVAGKIVEVEAYDGATDESAHSFNGVTPRTEVMFREGGYLYVYLSYGVHFCCNIVTGEKDKGTAILIRALEPVTGINRMAFNRFGKNVISDKEKINLTSGPGKLCKAMGIIKENNGTDLVTENIYLTESLDSAAPELIQTTRIGISKAKDFPWRFYIKDNPYVSRK